MAKKTQAQIEFKAVTSEFTSGIKDVNSSLKTMQNELKLNSAQLKNNGDDADLLSQRQQVLQRQYDATSQKIELTQKSLEEARRLLGENSTEYRNLENALLRAKTAQQNVQNEINQTSRRLDDLESSANNAEDNIESLSKEIDDLGDSANDTEGGFTTLKGAMASFAGNVLSNVTSKIGELAGELLDLNEETKEFRMNIAKLEGSTSQYGYSTEFTNQKIKEMYGYFQDEQVAVNTISNLQGLKLSEDELSNALNAGIAVWTAYGDSIPIEGLTESINESAQVAKVTGSLADALNWAGISEDDFNLKLAKCNSTKERAKLITDTLNGAYGKSKQTYDENTESLRENNEANMELIQAQAELGEAIEPVDTAFTNLKATALEAITPAILAVANGVTGVITAFQNLPQGVQTTILAIAGIAAALVGLIGGIGAISSAWGVITGIFSAGIGVFARVGGAIAGISTPVLIAVAVISTLIAIGITLYKNWDTIKAKASEVWNAIKTTISNVWNTIKTVTTTVWNAIKQVILIVWNIIQATVMTRITLIKGIIITVWNAIKTVTSTVWNAIKTFITTVWNTIKTTITNAVNRTKSIVQTGFNLVKTYIINPLSSAYNTVSNIFSNIYNTINTKINNAKNAVKTAIDKMKSFFNFKWSLPHIKLPHFSVSGSPNPIDWLTQGVPRISVQWYAKGAIMTQPTLFGGGEAGPEAVLPLDSFYNYLDNKFEMFANSSKKIDIDIDYDKLSKTIIQSLAKSNQGIYMNGELVGIQTADSVKRQNTKSENRLNRLGGVLDNV